MSTYHSTFARRKSTMLTGWASYCVTGGVLSGLIAVLFTLFLAPVALATQRDTLPQQEYLARTGVSLVRIVTTYGVSPSGGISLTPPASPAKSSTPSTNNTNVDIKMCTGLGVIVAGTGKTLWAVTDGSLVSTNGLTCNTIGLTNIVDKELKLNAIKVYVNDAYNNTSPQPVLAGEVASVRCNDAKNCNDSASLFSFQSNAPLPSINLSNATGVAQGDTAAIRLSQSLTSVATPTTANDARNYVTPTVFPTKETNVGAPTNLDGLETGTVIVDKYGFLNGIYLKSTAQTELFKTPEIADFLKGQGIASDQNATTLSTSWNDGITAYYQAGTSQYGKANNDFSAAYNASNKQFQGTQPFIQATNKTGALEETGGTPSGITLPILGLKISYLLLAIVAVGFIALIVLLFLLNSLFRRAQRHKDFAEADKQATIQAQQIQLMEAQQTPARPIPPRAKQNTQQTAPYPAQQAANGAMNVAPLASLAPVAPVQSSALADYPTLDMSEVKRNGILGMDKTQPFTQGLQHTVRDGGEELVGFEVTTSTDPGIKRKYKPNEDSLFALRGVRNANGHMQQIGLFVVADGMGGHANGQDASRLAIQTIIDYILPHLVHGNDASETPEKLLVDSVQLANQAVHQHNIEHNADMGTTVTATLVVDTTAHVANVGDSRTYLYRTSDGLAKVTRDHSVVASLVDAGIIQPDDIYTHPKRNQIYRSLGEKPFVEVDPFEVQLQPGDKLLLCSDGLWDMVRDPEIKHVLETPTPDPQQLGDNLIKAALNGGGEDNVSVIVINVVDHLPKPPTPGLETIYIQENVKMPPLS